MLPHDARLTSHWFTRLTAGLLAALLVGAPVWDAAAAAKKKAPAKTAPAKTAPAKKRTAAKVAAGAAALGVAGAAGAAAAYAPPAPAADYDKSLIGRHGFADGQVGFIVVDLDTNQVVRSHRAHDLYIPASVSKVPSTLAALHILGPEYRFLTKLQATGPVVDGHLRGDLYLVGGGDPSLLFSDLMNIAARLRHLGVREVDGGFYYDESLITPEPQISEEQNDDETYNQGLSALTLEGNRIRLSWQAVNNAILTTETPDLG
ncbi:MAG: D-alanyl-D-alanine carboxypeptidase, partial [Magnetococcales bacterium]|nr:D-alanyl-D-alanine carboxypeptidase [Magnetococcales bacterium]